MIAKMVGTKGLAVDIDINGRIMFVVIEIA